MTMTVWLYALDDEVNHFKRLLRESRANEAALQAEVDRLKQELRALRRARGDAS